MKPTPLLTLLAVVATLGTCSSGDQLDEFGYCLDACEFTSCHTGSTFFDNRYLKARFPEVSPMLRLLLWDCPSNCDYHCQQIITAERLNQGQDVVQFHGKWPFTRALGTQELASAIFSVLNFLPHYQNLQTSLALYNDSFGPIRILYRNIVLMSAITMFAWIFSTIFHIRDLLVTERLDYFFAGATVLSGFHGLVIRVLRLDRDPMKRHYVSIMCLLMYLYHFLRLNYDWSYTYNMRANIFIALCQYGLLLKMGYDHYKRDPKDLLWIQPPLLILSVVLAMSFEVFDFVSLTYQVDAHAMWHLFTVIPGYWLYKFLYRDIETLKDYYD